MINYLKWLVSAAVLTLFVILALSQEVSSQGVAKNWNFDVQFLGSMAKDDVSPGVMIGTSYRVTDQLSAGLELSYLVYRTILDEELYSAAIRARYEVLSIWNSTLFGGISAGVSRASIQEDFLTVNSNPVQFQINPRIGILLPADQIPRMIITIGYLRQRMDVSLDDGFGNSTLIDKTYNRYLLSLGISF